ncbi:LysR substrate-binding domain-containing protein [Nannocystaceae bacterium ST9]
MTPNPTLRQLESFVAVAELLSFRRAAERVHVSQPALSAQIAQLEEQLGVSLFERDRRGVMLTEAGRSLLPRARTILADVQRLIDTAAGHDDPLRGVLRLGVIPTVAPYLLPSVLPRLRAAYPQLRLYLREDLTERLLADLAAGELDLVLLACEAELGEVETLPLFRDRFLLAVPADHPLADRATLGQRDLEDQQVLLLEDGHCLRDQTLAACSVRGARERDDFRASSLGTLVQMVGGGLGVTLVPELAAELLRRIEPGVVLVRFAEPEPFRTIGLVWRPTTAHRESFTRLAATLLPSPA